MLNNIINLINYLGEPNNWCEPEDRTFYKVFTIWVMLSSYIMIGLYYYYPTVLDMLFWPLS